MAPGMCPWRICAPAVAGVLVGRPGVHQQRASRGPPPAPPRATPPPAGTARSGNRVTGIRGYRCTTGRCSSCHLKNPPSSTNTCGCPKPASSQARKVASMFRDLARAVDDHRSVGIDAQAGEELAIGARREQPGRNAAFAGAQRLGVEVLRARQMALEIGEDVGPDVDHARPARPPASGPAPRSRPAPAGCARGRGGGGGASAARCARHSCRQRAPAPTSQTPLQPSGRSPHGSESSSPM